MRWLPGLPFDATKCGLKLANILLLSPVNTPEDICSPDDFWQQHTY
ncbi:MAG: hypothetical protein IPP76_13410 [Moraxellaceae bacterium]|nr:hypothetical protein [Moraxellaceae bacterium]